MQSSSLFLRTCVPLVLALSSLTSFSDAAFSSAPAAYSLQTSYSGSNFFNGFDFFTEADYTHGFVTYVDQGTAQNMGLITAKDGSPVRIGVDYTNKYNGSANFYNINGVGRPSVRITSKQKFNHGLLIADIANMPGGVCGTWPALWTLGDGNWPYHGEIDIIEGVNSNNQDLTSLHTGGKCSVPGPSAGQTGTTLTTNCTYDTATGTNSAGCGVLEPDTSSFGLNFNSIGGGVFAMEWTSAYIKTWFFRRSAIPSDITSGNPSPSGWGTPHVNFQGDCNIDTNFANHQIILDTTFCGDWAGTVWGDSCAASTGVSSCSVYVGNNPGAFKDMYWSINSINMYQSANTSTTTTTTSTGSSTTTTRPTTSTTVSTTSMTTTTPGTTTTLVTSTTTTSKILSSSTTTPTAATTTSTSTTITTTKPSTTTTTTTITTKPSTTPTTTSTTKSSTTPSTTTTTSRRRFARQDDGVDGTLPTDMANHLHSHIHRHTHGHGHRRRHDQRIAF